VHEVEALVRVVVVANSAGGADAAARVARQQRSSACSTARPDQADPYSICRRPRRARHCGGRGALAAARGCASSSPESAVALVASGGNDSLEQLLAVLSGGA
jgi:hypothetical protein